MITWLIIGVVVVVAYFVINFLLATLCATLSARDIVKFSPMELGTLVFWGLPIFLFVGITWFVAIFIQSLWGQHE